MTTISLEKFSQKVRTSLVQSFKLYRKWWKPIVWGLFFRSLTLIVFVIILFIDPLFPDINDMNQLLTQALWYMFSGNNPYMRDYYLSALGDGPQVWYHQNYLNYGPMNLLLHLPAMIFPWSFPQGVLMDFQPSFTILHAFFDFLMFDRLMRKGHRFAAKFIWVNPIMQILNFVTHMSVPLFLLFMGYEKWDDPRQSVFWLGLGTITYQYIGLLLLFAIAYHIRSYRQWIIGLLPSIIVFGTFQLWASLEAILSGNPARHMALVHDLIIVQFSRGYERWFPDHTYSWWTWTGSIPANVINLFNLFFVPGPPTGPLVDPFELTLGLRLSMIMNTAALVIAVILLIYLIRRPNRSRSFKLSFLAMFLFLISSPSGILHHWLILGFPFFFLLRELGLWERKEAPEVTSPQ